LDINIYQRKIINIDKLDIVESPEDLGSIIDRIEDPIYGLF